jgi:phosphatidylserine/phosphatidylglycerophosphate/cardiolipin synthase-like enzyme
MFTFAGTLACPASEHEELQAAFAPEDDVEGLIIAEMDHAHRQILMQAYLLTNHKIADALVRAHRRGIDVRGRFIAG